MPTNNEKAINIALDAAGGRCGVKSITLDPDGRVPTMPIPERRGYDFDGWYTKVSGGEKIDTGMSANLSGVDELYARWSQNQKEISFREQKKQNNIRKKQQKAIMKTQPKYKSLHYIDEDDYDELPEVTPSNGKNIGSGSASSSDKPEIKD